jgi:hypothetical protein
MRRVDLFQPYTDDVELYKFEATLPTDPKDQVFYGGEITTPRIWLDKWKHKEDISRAWMIPYFLANNDSAIAGRDDNFKTRVEDIRARPNSIAYKDIFNVSGGGRFADMTELLFDKVAWVERRLEDRMIVDDDDEYFIQQHVRIKWNRQKQIVDEALMMGIFFELNKRTKILYIHYITRFWQGIGFSISVQNTTFTTYGYGRYGSEIVFAKVIEYAKEYGAKLLKIELATPGSRDLLRRRLLPKYFEKEWHVIPYAETEKDQTYPLKHLEFQLCNQCHARLATVGWENRKDVFCNSGCAQQKWTLIKGALKNTK